MYLKEFARSWYNKKIKDSKKKICFNDAFIENVNSKEVIPVKCLD